ncbi:trimeric intracellular cation channel family protein [Rhodoferax sp.]|uniref:trimeric intracellular cation channel family protein n=1 Tax=Rhodoferax sp. TaxID=50421 RepID=UPI00374D0380
MVLYLLDLLGMVVFAASGALAALHAHLDLLGVVVIAAITAIGGGTLRDVLLNRHPIFWIADPRPLWAIVLAALATILYVHLLPVPRDALLVADALGLALFAMSGAQLAERAGHGFLVIVFMGTLTGVGGGILRDVLTTQIPLVLRQDIYASAAMAGIALYRLMQLLGVGQRLAFGLGMAGIVLLRLSAIRWGLQLPVF